MATNQAVVVDQSDPSKLTIQDVPMPNPSPSEALVRVSAISLNRGETRGPSKQRMAGVQDGT